MELRGRVPDNMATAVSVLDALTGRYSRIAQVALIFSPYFWLGPIPCALIYLTVQDAGPLHYLSAFFVPFFGLFGSVLL